MNRQTKHESWIILTPGQERALQGLREGVATGDVVTLQGRAGSGKSTVLKHLHASTGGLLVRVREIPGRRGERLPEAIEEAFLQTLEQAMAQHDIVIVDDLHVVMEYVNTCEFPRALLLDAALTAILGEASAMRKKLVFSFDGEAPWPIRRRAHASTIEEFVAAEAN